MAISTVPYKPLLEDGTEEGGDVQQGLSASQAFIVAWDDRYTFANDVLGYSKGINNRAIPTQWPPSRNMFAQRVRIKGEGDVTLDPDADLPKWEWARVTVDFGTSRTTMDVSLQDPQFLNSVGMTTEERDALVWCEQEVDFSVEAVDLPRGRAKWASGDRSGQTVGTEDTGIPVRKYVGLELMTLTFLRMPFLPVGVIQDYIRKTNSGTFFGCDEGTIQFLGGKVNRQADTSGQIVQRVQLQFRWREADWNKELLNGQSWELVTYQDGSLRYPRMNFLDLINFRRAS